MTTMRVKADVAASVYDASQQMHVTLTPGHEYDSAHPLVKEYPWAFENDADNDDGKSARRARRADVEQATANPGEKR